MSQLLGKPMSQSHIRAFHPAIAAGLLLAAGLLAGCETDPDANKSAVDATAATEITDPSASSNLSGGGLGPIEAAKAELVRVGDRVFFETDHYDLSAAAEGTLRSQAALLESYPAITITIEGHADERGTREYNLALAERRAAAVRNYLGALGIDENRVETVSYGKERPDCPEATEDCWARNRRGVTVVNQ